MAKNENSPRRLKGYYKFSKKYPSRHGDSYAIGESRKMRKKERERKILFILLLCCLFVAFYMVVSVGLNLSRKPLPVQNENAEPIITVDNIGTIRAVFIDNETLGELSDLSEALMQAKENGFNAVMLDYKTQEGYLTFPTELIKNTGVSPLNPIDDAVVEKIKAEGFMIVARIFCFEDTVSPQRLGAYVYEDAEKTKIWFDAPALEGGKTWLDPSTPRATNYICSVINEAVDNGADCIYLQSVQFPQGRTGSTPVYTTDDSLFNKNAVLLDFIERAVASAGRCPVIIGMPMLCATDGDAELWGGTLFDTAASVCSPVLIAPGGSDYAKFVADTYTVMNEKAKNNFSTIKVIPTVTGAPEEKEFYEALAGSSAESYIVMK